MYYKASKFRMYSNKNQTKLFNKIKKIAIIYSKRNS